MILPEDDDIDNNRQLAPTYSSLSKSTRGEASLVLSVVHYLLAPDLTRYRIVHTRSFFKLYWATHSLYHRPPRTAQQRGTEAADDDETSQSVCFSPRFYN